MKQVSLYEAKTHLSKLVDEAAAGEEIVIAKNGKPKAKLTPVVDAQRNKEPRKLGQWATPQSKDIDWDKWWRDWKAMDKEIEADFDASIAKPFPRGAMRGFAEDADVGRPPRKGGLSKRKKPRQR